MKIDNPWLNEPQVRREEPLRVDRQGTWSRPRNPWCVECKVRFVEGDDTRICEHCGEEFHADCFDVERDLCTHCVREGREA